MVDNTKLEDQDEERCLIDSGATVNVTASDEGKKNIIKLNRQVKVGNGATCHTACEEDRENN
jgi:hypothetical protein